MNEIENEFSVLVLCAGECPMCCVFHVMEIVPMRWMLFLPGDPKRKKNMSKVTQETSGA